jgi:hypothetical protein
MITSKRVVNITLPHLTCSLSGHSYEEGKELHTLDTNSQFVVTHDLKRAHYATVLLSCKVPRVQELGPVAPTPIKR